MIIKSKDAEFKKEPWYQDLKKSKSFYTLSQVFFFLVVNFYLAEMWGSAVQIINLSLVDLIKKGNFLLLVIKIMHTNSVITPSLGTLKNFLFSCPNI